MHPMRRFKKHLGEPNFYFFFWVLGRRDFYNFFLLHVFSKMFPRCSQWHHTFISCALAKVELSCIQIMYKGEPKGSTSFMFLFWGVGSQILMGEC